MGELTFYNLFTNTLCDISSKASPSLGGARRFPQSIQPLVSFGARLTVKAPWLLTPWCSHGLGETTKRCSENTAHVGQSRPDAGLIFQVKPLKLCIFDRKGPLTNSEI